MSWIRRTSSSLKSPFSKKKIGGSSSRKFHAWLRFILKCIGILTILSILGGATVLFAFLRGVPDIAMIESDEYFEENTVIYDAEGKPIYTLFNDGKRTYASYNDISDAIKDAIISTEDKTFFENPGVDFKGLVRAGLNYVSGKSDRIKGTSTLSQQLISYTLLSKERSVKRKVQEAYLSYALNNNYSKEKILEMYLNRISYGNNANGVEEASKTYFGKSAKDVGPLGASILASLPKGPTYYSPYTHRDRLMGEVYVYPLDDPETHISLWNNENQKTYKGMYENFKLYLSGMTIKGNNDGTVDVCGINKDYVRNTDFLPEDDGCSEMIYDDLLNFLGDIIIRDEITLSGVTSSYALEYTIGRKDFVGLRMFEDGKIDGVTFQKIVYDGLEFGFKKYTENIQYPYFVMYIKEYLETKYGKDIDITKGLRVYTTIDPKLQQKAEELVKNQSVINAKQYGASSASLISMNNKDGSLLAMVGGPDYFDIENGGNNNMTISARQPGSSFKPFVYALAISKNPIGPKTPIADAKTAFSLWTPDNYDKKFKGIMTLEDALGYSRNIPAVKMFFLAGKEEEIIKYGRTLGFTTFKDNMGYGAPMAIGTAEVRPIDLMASYSVFANLGVKKEVYSIRKIEDTEGNIIEDHKESEEASEPIFSPAASYIVTSMLANIETRPEGFWRSALTLGGGRRIAVKTGTSNKDVSEGNEKKILPRDLWTVGYSPQITTVVWAGNVNGKETKGSCDGLNCAAAIWKPFMEFAHKDLPKEDWKKPEGIYEYTIAKMSGLLAREDTPDAQKTSTIMAVKLDEYDEGLKEEEIDTLCNGPISENTPPGAIGKILVPSGNPLIDRYDSAWKKGFFEAVGISGSGSRSVEPCERPGGPGNIEITARVIEVGTSTTNKRRIIEGNWSGDRLVREYLVLVNGEVKSRQKIEGEGKIVGSGRGTFVFDDVIRSLQFQVIDLYGFTYTYDVDEGIESDLPTEIIEQTGSSITRPIPSTKLPTISVVNPKRNSVNLYAGDPVNLRFTIDVAPGSREVNVYVGENRVFTASSGDVFVVPIRAPDLPAGEYPLTISVIDSNLRSTESKILLTILPR